MMNADADNITACAIAAAVISLASAFFSAGCASPYTGRSIDVRNPHAGGAAITEVKTFGPFYEHVETSAGDSRTSVMPFITTSINIPSDNAGRREILWPIYSSTFRRDHSRWRFITACGTDFNTSDPDSRRSLWILPFWFSGKAKDGTGYAAFFPLGGTIRDFPVYDRFSFFMWPLYSSFRQNDIEGKFILWPVFSSMRGDDTRKWRVFPFYAYARKDGKFEQKSILWPIWNSAKYFEDPEAGYEWMLFPLYGQADRTIEKSWYVIPPLFQYTRGYGPNDGYRRILAPWPLVRIEDSKEYKKRQFFPFYSTTWRVNPHKTVLFPNASEISSKGKEPELISARKTHVLWPFFSVSSAAYAGHSHLHWSFVPLFFRTKIEPLDEKQDGPVENLSYFRFWPLFSTDKHNDNRLVSIPDLSFQRRTGTLERNFLRMFTLYTYGSNEDSGEKVHNLLWGMFRRGSSPRGYSETRVWPLFTVKRKAAGEKSEWSVLAGLFGRDVDDNGSCRTRFLWFFRGPERFPPKEGDSAE